MAQKIVDDPEQGTDALETVTPQTAAEAAALRSAVLAALEELVRGEHVEIAEDVMALVVDELVLAGQEAHNPRHALKKLRIALIDSTNVEEVYADDHALEDAFRRAMGG